MLDRLKQIEERYEELSQELLAPELLADHTAYSKIAKQHRSLGDIVAKYRSWNSLKEEMAGAREMLETADDDELREMARLEVETLQGKLDATENELKLMLVPSDPNDEKNVIVEIRAGFSRAKFCACISATLKGKDGVLKFSMPLNLESAV
jgi:peptide chain release factor 1